MTAAAATARDALEKIQGYHNAHMDPKEGKITLDFIEDEALQAAWEALPFGRNALAAPAVDEVTQWRPIDSAPRNRRVWLGVWCNGVWDREICRWHPVRKVWTCGRGTEFGNPTHWFPVIAPEPPDPAACEALVSKVKGA